MNKIKYVIGDATNPINNNKNIILPHCVNSIGAWGSGFVLSLNKKSLLPQAAYKQWFKDKHTSKNPHIKGAAYKFNVFKLGNTQLVKIQNGLWVANMIAQEGIIGRNNPKPVKYRQLMRAMEKVLKYSKDLDAEIHAPRFCSALAGGNWLLIEELIYEIWINNNINVTIYDLPKK